MLTDKGDKGDANDAVIKALIDAGMLIARARLKHQYPHSWRSKKPVIFRNTPQWFIAMDQAIADGGHVRQGDTLRHRALAAIKTTRWVPPQGENRITGMIANRPDWVISRQRAWGVPIAVFMRERPDGTVEILKDAQVNARIAEAFERDGADAWYEVGAAARFLAPDHDPADWKKVDDILDVWFDSGSTHAFTLEVRDDLKVRRRMDGGSDSVMYLEGSDQHRGWFHSSLLESCGTRGRAPFDVVLTHGFVLDEHGRKMSKSLGNVVAPQDVIKQSGADILRMWVCASDYADDLRIGPEILKTTVETYRKLRNTIRWMLGNLAHFRPEDRVAAKDMPELERLMLHRLAELDRLVRQAYADFDYKRIFAALNAFMTVGPLGVLLRHPQGRALLRSDLLGDPQGLPDRARSSVPHDRHLACADAVLHRRGGLARALSAGDARCTRALSGGAGRLAQRCAGREMAQGAQRAPRRHRRARARARRQAHRLIARSRAGRVRRPIRTCSRLLTTSTLPRSASPRLRPWSKARGRPDAFRLPDVRGVAVVPGWPRGANAPAPGRSRPRSAAIRNIRT